ncbi:SurA N-terminal domain-containing protein [Xinfangfangia sp. CPCC 101601]|uniref:SurA N-terminal domain-containing protein n=1 Tax=Pseudogemmobacter lacusdianii TaxID=3069608 RepID=A0ABU0W0X6_9RHOB|nr:peptidylprolyl isomerase [Xinfangfangia sp. CPCC 101601]MDQ2067553.1 SurA N-terminal domain-containing protein [Xinfangfangia sp. CPCC 101601]
MSNSARPDLDDDTPRKKPKKGQQVATWIMMGMLIVGLGGFGATSFSGSIVSIGSVGGLSISTRDYSRALQQEMASFSQQLGGAQISPSEAVALGIDQRALSMLVTRTALDAEAARLGLSIGDGAVAEHIRRSPAFSGITGGFDRETYAFTLRQNGWTEADYETSQRRDASRELLQGAIAGGVVAPQAMVDAFYHYIGERRSLSTIRLSEADLIAALAEADEADLQAWYDANIADFTKPQSKRIGYVALLPEDIAADQPVDEAALRATYDARIAEYVQPERRLVERLVFPDQAAADAAKARLDAGESFETLVTERGLELVDIDMGDISEAELGAAGAAVFASAEGAVVAGESALGPALYRVNGLLPGENVSFEEARAELAAESQAEAARREIADKVDHIDDLLAGGADLEELVAEAGMTYATLDHVPGAQGGEGIAGYAAFRTAADAAQAGDFPEAILLDDGGVAALRFIEDVPAAPIPFAEVRDQVAEAFAANQLKTALAARAIEIKSAVEGGASLGTQGIVDQTPEIARSGTVPDAPQALVTAAFEMQPGELRVIEEGDFVAVVQLNAVTPAAETGPDAEALKASIAAQIQQALAGDLFDAYATALINATPMNIDQNAISAVNTSLQ